MQINKITISGVEAYIRQHWFKLIMAALVVFIFINKDMSLSLNLDSPLEEEVAQKIKTSVELPKVYREERKSVIEKKRKLKEEKAKANQLSAKLSQSKVDKQATKSKKKSMFEIIGWPFGKQKEDHSSNIEVGNYGISVMTLESVEPFFKRAYVERFGHVAINEQKKFGIPACIILANGLLNSRANQSALVKQGNNHFAIPCTFNWSGESDTYNDACYRHYANAWSSFRDHSLYISNSSLSKLITAEISDYKIWSKAIEQSNLFDEQNIGRDLVRIIEQYGLDELDR